MDGGVEIWGCGGVDVGDVFVFCRLRVGRGGGGGGRGVIGRGRREGEVNVDAVGCEGVDCDREGHEEGFVEGFLRGFGRMGGGESRGDAVAVNGLGKGGLRGWRGRRDSKDLPVWPPNK